MNNPFYLPLLYGENRKGAKWGIIYVYLAKENLFYGAFSGCSQLLTIDASACTKLASIGKYAFYNASQLYLFKIGAATPPKCYNEDG